MQRMADWVKNKRNRKEFKKIYVCEGKTIVLNIEKTKVTVLRKETWKEIMNK